MHSVKTRILQAQSQRASLNLRNSPICTFCLFIYFVLYNDQFFCFYHFNPKYVFCIFWNQSNFLAGSMAAPTSLELFLNSFQASHLWFSCTISYSFVKKILKSQFNLFRDHAKLVFLIMYFNSFALSLLNFVLATPPIAIWRELCPLLRVCRILLVCTFALPFVMSPNPESFMLAM